MAARRTRRIKALVLDRTKLGEQDLILTCLTDTGEELRAVAKGARKPGGRLAARTELFSEVDMLVAEGRSLFVVSEASLLSAHEKIRGDLSRVSAASTLCEIARLTCIEGYTDTFLFPILSRALTAVERASDEAHLDVIVAAYVFKVLAHGGWRPELHSCIACGDEAPTFFSPRAGGVLCASCAREVEGAEALSASQRVWLASLISLTFDQIEASAIDAETAFFLLSLAHMWAATHLDARLRAFEFLLSV